MSIISSIYADYAEEIKKEWVHKLKHVLNDKSKSDGDKLTDIEKIVNTINKHHFSE